ncbi:MAG: 4'-phosphopantetheinyl transferase superfamily protein [Smithellaceae bacterium]
MNAGRSRDSRFLKKILTVAETDFVQDAENPDKALWAFWSCKETAYKVIKKKCGTAVFLPCRWEVILQKSEAACLDGEVKFPDAEVVYVRLFSHFRYVHCVGADHPADLDRVVSKIEVLPEKENKKRIDPSLFARKCLTLSIADFSHLNLSDIRINRVQDKSELQPPHVYIGGKKSDIDISLSHDGQFVAYAFLS